MKKNPQLNKKNQAISGLTVCAIATVFSFAGSFTAMDSTLANPIPYRVNTLSQQLLSSKSLPRRIRNAVLKDITSRENISRRNLTIVNAREKTWRNGCLELPRKGELCTQVLVKGWRVVVSDKSLNRTWVYHTNENGRSLRFAASTIKNPINGDLPSSVKNAVIKAASKQLKLSPSKLYIIQAQKRTWRDSCLGIADPARACALVITPGWRVVVGAEEQVLVYHTDADGRFLLLNKAASTIDDNENNSLNQQTRQKILEYVSSETGAKMSQLRISSIKNIIVDGCLNLPEPGETCTELAIRANQVTVRGRKLRVILHVTPNGQQIRIDKSASRIPLPETVRDRVINEAKKRTNARRIRIIASDRQTWSNGCLDIPNSGICTAVIVPGWRVRVRADDKELVYHTNINGGQIRYNPNPSNNDPTSNLSEQLRDRVATPVEYRVLNTAAKTAQQPKRNLQILSSEPRVWLHGCENNQVGCRPRLVRGMLVKVGSRKSGSINRWTFLTDSQGNLIKLHQRFRETRDTRLPNDIKTALLAQAAQKARVSPSQLQITDLIYRTYPNGCGGRESSGFLCATVIVSNWEVKIRTPRQILTYEVSEGGRIALKSESLITANTYPSSVIPSSQLSQALEKGVIFRQVSTGGFTGQTYETILRTDGRLIQTRMGDTNDKNRRVAWVKPAQIRQFIQLLSQQAQEFQNTSYPVSQGAADYLTYTLTSSNGSVEYSDASQENLSPNLAKVIQAWKQLQENLESR